MPKQHPHPEPRFRVGQHVQINLRPSVRGTASPHTMRPPIRGIVVALGYTYMATPTIVYRIQLDAPRVRSAFWGPRAITSGPYDELVIEDDLLPGQEDFDETALVPPDAVTQLGNLA